MSALVRLKSDRSRQLKLAEHNLETADHKLSVRDAKEDQVVRGEGTLVLQVGAHGQSSMVYTHTHLQ